MYETAWQYPLKKNKKQKTNEQSNAMQSQFSGTNFNTNSTLISALLPLSSQQNHQETTTIKTKKNQTKHSDETQRQSLEQK